MQIVLEHYLDIINHYGESVGLPLARKHIGWYSSGLHGSAEFRSNVNQQKSADKVLELIKNFYEEQIENIDLTLEQTA